MSPMPTPEYEEFLNDMRRAGRRADGEKQTPDRSHAARDNAGVRPDLPHPRLLELDWRHWCAKAHLAWARQYAPWLLEEQD